MAILIDGTELFKGIAGHSYYSGNDILTRISAMQEGKHPQNSIPAADVVSRDCFDRILAENDVMREQLAAIGKKPGDPMNDVRPIVLGHWLWDGPTRTCSVCGQMRATDRKENLCSNCGAYMNPEILDMGGCQNA